MRSAQDGRTWTVRHSVRLVQESADAQSPAPSMIGGSSIALAFAARGTMRVPSLRSMGRIDTGGPR